MNNEVVLDPRRLELLLDLSRLGSMAAVAEARHVTTSTVSQQIATLAREAGVPVIEPDGRRVRLTPAGHRLAEHAVAVLSALEQARLDLDPDAAPRGTVRVASFATGMRRSLMPVIRRLASDHPDVRLLVREHEPDEAFDLLDRDGIDLALTYDFNLAPASFDPTLESRPLWEAPWHLGVPASSRPEAAGASARPNAVQVFAEHRDAEWIANSRNSVDENVLRAIATMAGFEPQLTHRADSLELVQDLVSAGLGVGLLPASHATIAGVRLVPLHDPEVLLRCFVVTRRGRSSWPPLALVHRLLTHG
jgi:DNA-binding transcriptional LysR family regulator